MSLSVPAPSETSTLPTSRCVQRINLDLKHIFQSPLPGIFVHFDPADITTIFALLTGLEETPYFGGFFAFKMSIPGDYPNLPPKVEFLTTSGGRVRFGPNLYANGKVCLSILGTWTGPGWTPSQSISSVLLSIQTLMNSKPYFNEPGFENTNRHRESDLYSECIRHETIRVAFCEQMENLNLLPCMEFQNIVKIMGPTFYEIHQEYCQERVRSSGQPMLDPHGDSRGLFEFKSLLSRLETLKERYPAENEEDSDEEEE